MIYKINVSFNSQYGIVIKFNVLKFERCFYKTVFIL